MSKFKVLDTIVVPMIREDSKVLVSLENGFILDFIKEREGINFFNILQAYSNLVGGVVCLNKEQAKALEEIKEQVTADAEEPKEEKPKKFELDPSKTYAGDDGIDYIILFLQNTDLTDKIERDDSKTLFVDLGELKMFPDAENMEWIMKLNARIPLRSALSIGCRVKNGVKHFGVVLHDSFV